MKTTTPGAGASFVCGILSIVLFWLPLAGLILGIVGIVKSNKARRIAAGSPQNYAGGGQAAAGLVCGIIGVVLSVLWTFMLLISIVSGLFWLRAGHFELDRAKSLERSIRDERVIPPAHPRPLSEESEELRSRPVVPAEARPRDRAADSSEGLLIPPADQGTSK